MQLKRGEKKLKASSPVKAVHKRRDFNKLFLYLFFKIISRISISHQLLLTLWGLISPGGMVEDEEPMRKIEGDLLWRMRDSC